MSELVSSKKQNFRRNLLANVSLLALLGYLGTSQGAALAADDDQPTLWIELGGQAERISSANEMFAPPFVGKAPTADRNPMVEAQEPSPFSIGGEGKITFRPRDTKWVLSAAILYGRSDAQKHDHQQTPLPYVERYYGTRILPQFGDKIFGDGQTDLKESHAVLDFKAGRDVGLGMFGNGGTSVFSAGVRFAQFISHSDVTLHARPDYHLGAIHSGRKYQSNAYYHRYLGYRTANVFRHTYGATFQASRNSHALGPSISWDASLPVAGSNMGMAVVMDWGVNAAILFGRQRTKISHQTTGHYYSRSGQRFKYPPGLHEKSGGYANAPVNLARSRGVTIPNVGGFAGVTFQRGIAKINVGYKADFFFGAMDGGIDAAKKTNVGFYGPFATISVGIGG